ncbi:ABC transporter permease [Georgenia yuyongxinii]|uniref:ABC transporter permease n=1 Tax=Georgenia yuyongxinii TaxID=2589797 RepID=A0A552WQR6_9MICO|nr:ABC transporter permease [Georgenia yuyongxinii]TRW45110.1 ABC transporter permease [Georgenia yuyongxinii]
MTATTTAAPREETSPAVLLPVSWRWPAIYGVLTAVTLVVFTLLPERGQETTFQLSRATDLIAIPNFAVPSVLTNWVLTAIMLALTLFVTRLALARKKVPVWAPIVFGTAFVLSFLVWVGAGRATVIPLTTLLQGALALSVPLVFGALCGVLCERSGIVNIAIEGQLLGGAFLAAVIGSLTSSAYLGMIAAPIAGALVGVLLSFFAVRYWVDQIIVGVVLNVLVIGLTSFLFSTVLTENAEQFNARQRLPNLPIPLLSEIPVIGPVLFNQNLLVYLMYVAVIVLQIFLFRSRWGLRVRSVGEHPKAADTVGIKVNRTRVRNTILGGAVAGLGGAFFTVGSGLAFGKEMSAGQGYIALAAMILGKWNPTGALAAALLFGFSKNLGNVLSTIGSPVPSEFLLMLPYVVTIFAVAGFVGRVRAPAAENIPYIK